MKKRLTTGQRLARMLRTAVIECQAVERGVHPNITLDMGVFGCRDSESGETCGCLGGVYAMLSKGLTPFEVGNASSWHATRKLTREESALNDLRAGMANRAARSLELEEALPEDVAERFTDLVLSAYNSATCRADWDTYLEAADILEKA